MKLQFKAELTGVAVVDDYMVFYDSDAVAKIAFLPPQTPVMVSKGKSVIFKMSYDFPDECPAFLWTRGVWPNDNNIDPFGNPSGVYHGKGVAYGFIWLDSYRKTCTLESVKIDTGAHFTEDSYWAIGIEPVKITFK